MGRRVWIYWLKAQITINLFNILDSWGCPEMGTTWAIIMLQWNFSANVDNAGYILQRMVCLICSEVGLYCLTFFDIHGLSLTNSTSDHKTVHTCTTIKNGLFLLSSWWVWFCLREVLERPDKSLMFLCGDIVGMFKWHRTWHRPITQHIQSRPQNTPGSLRMN